MSVERVISLVVHVAVLFQVTLDSTKEEQAWAEMVVAEVPTTLYRYILNSIDVGVMAVGHGMLLKSNSIRMLL